MNITRGKVGGALKVVIYGPEGIGKSTLASRWPEPVFIDTEGSTRLMDVARMDTPSSWTILLSQVDYIRDNPGVCKTLVIDTADWAEQMCIASFCASKQIKGIEDMGYGKGYVYIAEDFGKLLNRLEEIRDRGTHVVVTAHAQMRKFEQPDELGAYDRWELKLNKKTAALLKEWADVLLFANYKTMVVNVDGQGAQKGKNKAQGGKRVLYTSHNPCWDAKNRLGMPEEMPMEWEALAPFVVGNTANGGRAGLEPAPTNSNMGVPAEHGSVGRGLRPQARFGGQPPVLGSSWAGDGANPAPESVREADRGGKAGSATTKPGGALGKLFDLMDAEQVTPDEVMEVVAQKGYFPRSTPLEKLPEDFVEGVLVGAWPQVLQAIKNLKKGE